MALRRKGSAPWSLTKDTGLSDAPVSGSPFVEGDEVKPVIDAGYIDDNGFWQIRPSDDLAFTFQDPSQALAAGADMEFIVNLQQHDTLIIAIVDTSGNDINAGIRYRLPTTLEGIYAPFQPLGVKGDRSWVATIRTNDNCSLFCDLLGDTNEDLFETWRFFKLTRTYGTIGRINIHNNDSSNAGTISTAYMRLV